MDSGKLSSLEKHRKLSLLEEHGSGKLSSLEEHGQWEVKLTGETREVKLT